MPRPKDPGRRDELEAALVDHVLATGVADLSLRGAAAALGISTYPLVYHFGSRDGLVAAVLGGVEDRLRAEVAGWAAAPDQDLAAVVHRFWDWAAGDEAQPLFLVFFEVQALALRHPERFPGFLDRVWPPWLALLRQLAADRSRPAAEADAVAWLVVAGLAGSLLGLLATGDRAAADRGVDLLLARLPGAPPVHGDRGAPSPGGAPGGPASGHNR